MVYFSGGTLSERRVKGHYGTELKITSSLRILDPSSFWDKPITTVPARGLARVCNFSAIVSAPKQALGWFGAAFRELPKGFRGSWPYVAETLSMTTFPLRGQSGKGAKGQLDALQKTRSVTGRHWGQNMTKSCTDG